MTRTILAALASSLILSVPASAQTAAPEQAPRKRARTFEIVGREWPKALQWQAAPTGAGEFLAFPHPAAGEPFAWNKQRIIGTPLGLLRAEGGALGDEQWKIVPAFYGRSARVVGASDGLLWIESQGQGVIALDEKFAVAQRLASVKGRCIAASKRGFWCLDDLHEDGGDSVARLLVEYDAAGKPKRRWSTNGLALAEAESEPKAKQNGFGGAGFGAGRIAWASVDENAVWVSLSNYWWNWSANYGHGQTQGSEVMGRLDRATGRFTPIEIPAAPIENGRPQVLGGRDWADIGERIVWLSRYSDPDVLQLDKKSGQISRAFKLVAPGYSYSGIRIHNGNLWLISQGDPEAKSARVFSLHDYEEVKRREAGAAPWSDTSRKPHFPAPDGPSWVGILATSEHSAWLSGPSNRLLEARDESQPQAFNIEDWLRDGQRHYFPAVATEAALLWLSRENLVRFNSGGEHSALPLVSFRNSKQPDQLLPFLAASSGRVWLQTEASPLTALSPDLLQTRTFAESQLGYRRPKGTVAAGDVLYTWSENGHLLRMDAATGQSKRVESWSRRLTDDKPADEPYLFVASPRREFAERCDAALVLPDGRLAFRFAEVRDYPNPHSYIQSDKQEDKARLLIFNPVTDTWQEAEGPAEVDPIATGARVFGVDKGGAYEWRGSRWQSIGLLPVAARELPFSHERETIEQKATLAGTQHYLYRETPLGLYRVAWSVLAAP